MEEPHQPRACSTSRSAPPSWLRAAPPAPPPPCPPDPDALRAAIELVLRHPEAVAEVVERAPAAAFACRAAAGRTRSDGWTGERMATFLEVLADTGLVTEAIRVTGMNRDSAYALRNRDPLFDAAWAAAKSKARPHLADGLLERSITGTVEHYYRDGVLVGERRHYESWLGLAVLKRLDKQAAEDRADRNLSARIAADWQAALDALREGGSAAVAPLLQAETDETDTPASAPGCSDSDNVWQDDDGSWLTSFPPPPGFEGYEKGRPHGIDYYERACTDEEVEAIEAWIAAEDAHDRADRKRARDSYFASLKAETAAALAKAARANRRSGDCGGNGPPVEREE